MSDQKSRRKEPLDNGQDLVAESVRLQELLKKLLDRTAQIIDTTRELLRDLEDRRKPKKSDQ
jgi:RNase adaptor protein for sRNA GlmZ degradation